VEAKLNETPERQLEYILKSAGNRQRWRDLVAALYAKNVM
jgi:hypothetical protein